jgi:acetyltransferase
MTTNHLPLVTRDEAVRLIARPNDSLIWVRQAAPRDIALLTEMLTRLSDRTRYLRYCTARPLSGADALREAARATHAPAGSGIALIATVASGAAEQAVALAELAGDPGSPAIGEIALLVRDDYQRQGIGTALGHQLLRLARARGITTLRGELLAENRAVPRLLRRLGLRFTTSISHGQAQIGAQLPEIGAPQSQFTTIGE